ncbi:MAG: glycosyltransferase family 4 protein [Acidimicrobiales bacterium]
MKWPTLRGRLRRSCTEGRPIRVAVVSDGLYPYLKGGKEVRLHHLMSHMDEMGLQVVVCTMRWWGPGQKPQKDGLEYYALCRPWPMYAGGRRSVAQALAFAVGSLKLLTKRFDIIDADHMPYLHVLPLWVVAHLRRVPLVVTWHEWWGKDYWTGYLGPMGLVAAWVERSVARRAGHVVASSEATATRLLAGGVAPARLSVLPLGVDLSAVAKAPVAAKRYDVLFMGRLLQHKGVDMLVQAIARLRDEGLQASCGIYGEGPEADHLDELISSLKLRGHVELHPPVADQSQVFGLMKAARVFAYPSVREGFGLAVAEALACGTPVVTSNHPDNNAQYLVKDGATGLVCPPSAAGLAGALRKALREPGMLAPNTADLAELDWSARARDLAALYRSQLNDAPLRPAA